MIHLDRVPSNRYPGKVWDVDFRAMTVDKGGDVATLSFSTAKPSVLLIRNAGKSERTIEVKPQAPFAPSGKPGQPSKPTPPLKITVPPGSMRALRTVELHHWYVRGGSTVELETGDPDGLEVSLLATE